MKILKPLLLLLLIAVYSCTDTDDNTTDAELLNGSWKLLRVSGSIAGVDHTFPPGTITWTFDADSRTLSVDNNNTNPTLQDGLENGVYDFGFMNSQAPETCQTTLLIDGEDYGCYIFEGETLRISQAYTDGLMYDFVR